MESGIAEALNIDKDLFHFIMVPILIFLARVVDVSINTMRVMFMLGGKKVVSVVLGFFEAFIWLVAISQILQNISSIASYFAYAGGFAAGIYVGMFIEEKLAVGNVIVRIITQINSSDLISVLRKRFGFKITSINAETNTGKADLIFLVLKRNNLKGLIEIINQYSPNAFYTIENVKYVKEDMAPNLFAPGAH
jgi:uncharacterized protein YebE (UPF0316 family)